MRCLVNLLLVALCLRQDCSVHAFRQSAAKSHSTRSIALSARSLALSTALQYDNASVNAAVDAPSSDYADAFLELLWRWVHDTPTVDTSPLDVGYGNVVKCGEYTVDLAKSTKDVAVKTMEFFTLMSRFWKSLKGMNKFLDRMSPKIDELVRYLQQQSRTLGGRYIALNVVVELLAKGKAVYQSLSLAKEAYDRVQAIVEKILGATPPPPPAPLSVQLKEAVKAGRKAQGVFTRVHEIVAGLGIRQLGSHFNDLSGQLGQLTETLQKLEGIEARIRSWSQGKQVSYRLATVASFFHGNASENHPQGVLMKEAHGVLLQMLGTSNQVWKWYAGWMREWSNLKASFERQLSKIRQLFESIGVSACGTGAKLLGC